MGTTILLTIIHIKICVEVTPKKNVQVVSEPSLHYLNCFCIREIVVLFVSKRNCSTLVVISLLAQ